MIVIDASAAVDLVGRLPRAPQIADRLSGQDLVAPELIDVEILSALARLERATVLSREQADSGAAALMSLPIHRISHAPLRELAWSLHPRIRLAEAFYVACAQLIGVPLLTTDARLTRAAVPDLSLLLVT